MSAATGRPRGAIPETQQRDREILALTGQGWPPAAIMERVGVSRAEVYRSLSRARGAPVEVQREAEEPKPRQRLSERTLTHRAVTALRCDIRFRRLTGSAKVLWLECVLAIHQIGDGLALLFEDWGFDGSADFAADAGGTEAELALLIRRGLLVELDGGIGMPEGLGLKPRERSRRGPSDPRQVPLPPVGMQREFPETRENLAGESHETTPPESQKTPPESHEILGDSLTSRARADSLSLSPSSHGLFVQTTEEKEGERESGEGCGEGTASHASHGFSPKSHAARLKQSQDSRAKFPSTPAPPPREMRQIPDDFELTAADRKEAQRRGYDADAAAEQFFDVYRGRGKFSADWSAEFRAFVRRGIIGPPPPQATMPNMPRSKGEDFLSRHLREFAPRGEAP